MKNIFEVSLESHYQFEWDKLGNIKKGREHLGEEMPVLGYRLLEYSMNDGLFKNFGIEKTDEIFRQAAQSKIIVNSHRVNDGEYFLDKEEQEGLKDDFFYIKEKSQDIMLDQIISLCKGRLKNFGDYDFFENIQILSPTKKDC